MRENILFAPSFELAANPRPDEISELGLNPKKFGGLANHRQEPWKTPLPGFIEEIRAPSTEPAQ